VGYKLSPLLWSKVRRGLSAGRVQSIVLRLIVEREREIEQFQKRPYWTISVILSKPSSALFEASLTDKNGQKYEKTTILNLFAGTYSFSETSIDSTTAQEIINDLKKQKYIVKDLITKEIQRQPYAPLVTSTMQQAANRTLGLSSKRTMQLAQQLYERGLITYHRTDSTSLSIQAINQIRKYILTVYGEKYLPSSPRIFKTKTKNAQEAHEAIRPTDINKTSQKLEEKLDPISSKLYDLIHRRSLGCQMSSAIFSQKNLVIKAGLYGLSANGVKVIFDGFLKLYPKQLKENNLPDLKVGDELKATEWKSLEHQTQPPPRYSEASLVKILESKGIGRPSTYAPTITLILARQYVEKNEGYFYPTNIGIAVNDFLVKNFSEIINIPFTAQMEDDLDTIASGDKLWVPVVREFYEPFAKKLTEVTKTGQREKIAVETTGDKCPMCKTGDQVIRIGRFGKFLSCSHFPECKWKAVFIEKLEGIKCPQCGGDVVIRKTRFGKQFYGCSKYPACKWASWRKPKE
jgi:DNA topoisomerase I